MNVDPDFDVIVVGSGPTGLLACLGLVRAGLRVAMCGQFTTVRGRPRDTRTAALFNSSISVLENLGVWKRLEPHCATLRAIRIVDSMGQLARGPEVTFSAPEVGLERLGWNVPNAPLVDALVAALREQTAGFTSIESDVAAVTPQDSTIDVHLVDGGTHSARLVVGADGRESITRQGAGIEVRRWRYDQAALTATFSHSRPHHDISTEFHRRSGPFTVVPLPGRCSSLVWVERPAAAQHHAELPDTVFLEAVEEHLQGLLGRLSDLGPRQVFPLSSLMAKRCAGRRVALVGEAAHAFPPIGAQGLNLGFRDIAAIVDCVTDAIASGRDIGGPYDLERYASHRSQDIALRTAGVDVLNRTLISAILPVDLMRGAVLHTINTVPAVKRLFIAAGMAPPGQLPSLMRPAATPA